MSGCAGSAKRFTAMKMRQRNAVERRMDKVITLSMLAIITVTLLALGLYFGWLFLSEVFRPAPVAADVRPGQVWEISYFEDNPFLRDKPRHKARIDAVRDGWVMLSYIGWSDREQCWFAFKPEEPYKKISDLVSMYRLLPDEEAAKLKECISRDKEEK